MADKAATAGQVATSAARSLAFKGAFYIAGIGVIAAFVAVAATQGFTREVSSTTAVRDYFLAAEEVEWDYAPRTRETGVNLCSNVSLGDEELVFLGQTTATIGSVYHKRIWKAYTDATFTTRLDSLHWSHAGLYGPTLRANVGDTIRVTVKNTARYPASFHINGLPLLSVRNMGQDAVLRPQDTSAEADAVALGEADAVLPDVFSGGLRPYTCIDFTTGGQCTRDAAAEAAAASLAAQPGHVMEYTYYVTEAAGPSPAEGPSTARLYQSATYSTNELSLTGIVVITPAPAKGNALPQRPAGVSEEFLSMFSVSNENGSPYLNLNILDFILRPQYTGAAAQRGSAVLPYAPHAAAADVLAALAHAAAEASGVTIADGYDFSSHFTGSHVTVPSIQGVQLGLVFHTGDGTVDATSYVARYGQITAEETVAAVVAEGFMADPGFDAGAFEESNLMHSHNGLMYCNSHGLVMQEHALARWYVSVVGSEVDMHTAHWHGNTLVHTGARTDAIQLLPRVIAVADMVPENVGTWLYHCHITDHLGAGMVGTYTVLPSSPVVVDPHAGHGSSNAIPPAPVDVRSQLTGVVREYFIAAEVVQWDYTTPGGEAICRSFDDSGYAAGHVDIDTILPGGNTTFTKAVYRQYTDATFTTPSPIPSEWQHLQLVGPMIRGAVGDTIRVTFKNNAPAAFSVHPHGVLYPKNSEGAPYADGTTGSDKMDDAVLQGQTHTYTWFVPDSAGPGPADGSSMLWLYHGHFHEVKDENSGLVGGILITARGKATSANNLRPADVDREFMLLVKAFDESSSSITDALSGGSGGVVHHSHRQLSHEDEESLVYAVNGKVACGVPGLSMHVGERVRVYVGALGNEIDVHNLAFQGQTLTHWGHRVSGIAPLAGTMYTLDLVPEAEGTWLLTDQTAVHAEHGLAAHFTVLPAAAGARNHVPVTVATGETRHYYVAADTVIHDFLGGYTADMCVPSAMKTEDNGFSQLDDADRYDAGGLDLNGFTDDGRIFVEQGGSFLGHKYKKAVYREYTSDSFTTVVSRSDARLRSLSRSKHLGLLGPVIRATVGDTVVVRFKNSVQEFATNFHPQHGLHLTQFVVIDAGGVRTTLYDASASGAQGSDAALAAAVGYAVPPGEVVEYTYFVPASAGPAERDPDTIAWMYSSTVDAVPQLYAGLLGAVLVSRPAAPTAGVRDFVLSFYIANENLSPFLQDNIDAFAVDPSAVVQDEEFEESNLLHSVNGLLMCTLDGLTANRGETVRFHLLAVGSALDIHTPTFHGNAVTRSRVNSNAVDLYPGSSRTVELKADHVGSWLVECGLADHWMAGMRVLFTVL